VISVVIPLYNKAKSIKRAIESVRAQTLTDWELIVVDDGSRDNGPDIVRSIHDARIRLVSQTNAGVSAARNRGAAEARTEWVAFLDADDYWAPDHLQTLRGLIERFPNAALYSAAFNVITETGNVRRYRLHHDGEAAHLVEDFFASAAQTGHHLVNSSTVAMTKTRLTEVGGFPMGIVAGEDMITWARLACAGDVAYSSRATAYITAPPVSAAARDGAVRCPQTPDYVGAGLAELNRKNSRFKQSLRRFSASWHRIRAMSFLESNQRSECLAELRRAISLSRPTTKDVMCVALLALPSKQRKRVLAQIRRFKGHA
jgi:glycosyltransferase involved in cell wall biosynthesis